MYVIWNLLIKYHKYLSILNMYIYGNIFNNINNTIKHSNINIYIIN